MNAPSQDLADARALLRSPDFQGRIQDQLDGTLATHDSLNALIVSTIDGRAFSHASRQSTDPQRLAALGSTLLSICYTLGREIRAGGVQYTSLMLDQAVIVTRRIPDRSRVFTLSLIGAESLNMAMALRWSTDTSAALARSIDQQLSQATNGLASTTAPLTMEG